MGYIQSVSKYGKVDLAWNDEPGRAGSRAARSGGYRLEISAGNKRHVIGSGCVSVDAEFEDSPSSSTDISILAVFEKELEDDDVCPHHV